MNGVSCIVGIGVSGNEVDALQSFLGAIPPDTGMAFVVVHHADGVGAPALVAQLEPHARIRVREIVPGDALAGDTVQIVPTGRMIDLRDGVFHAVPDAPETGLSSPIDTVFAALAQQSGAELVAVLLPGAGPDGGRGLAAVRQAGGIAIGPDVSVAWGDDPASQALAILRALWRPAVGGSQPAGDSPDRLRRRIAALEAENTALARANGELGTLLEGTDIATLYLDEQKRIRRFTPALAALFEVDDGSIGAGIADLMARVDYPQLAHDAAHAMETLQPVNREVQLPGTGQIFAARVSPCHGPSGGVDGCVISFVDVSVRRTAERQLEDHARAMRQNLAEMESIYDSAPVGLAVLDRDHRYLRINEELAALNGLPVEAHIGKRQEDLLPELGHGVREAMRHVFETGAAKRGVVGSGKTPKDPDRVHEWVSDFFPIMDEDTVFAVGVCVQDVTEQRELEREATRALEAARESEARMARLFDQAPAAIAIFEGPEHRYIYVNQAHDTVVGRTDLIGQPMRKALPELQGQGVFANFERVFATGEPFVSGELPVRFTDPGGDGRQAWFQQIIQPWFRADGRVGGTMAFNHDVTELVEAREQVARSIDRLRKIQDSLMSFVGLLDLDGTLKEANKTALLRAGLTRDDVIGKPFWDCWWWSHDADLQDRLKGWVRAAAAGRHVHEECQIRLTDDEIITIDFQLVPSVDDEGRVTELVPSGIDVTNWKEAEARKDTLLAELQHRVKNVLATVQAISRFTARHSDTKEALVESLQQRLVAMSRTHDALTRTDWGGTSLRDIVESEVAPYVEGAEERLAFEGPDVMLDPATALSLALALHELSTNAAKHGALSQPDGRVVVSTEARAGRLASFDWREEGGPEVAPPRQTGFGSFLLERILTHDLEAEVSLEYPVAGVHFRIDLEPGGGAEA